MSLMLVRAVKKGLLSGDKIETEILGGDPRVVPSVISFLDAKYKDEIEDAISGVFSLIGAVAQLKNNQNL